MDEVARIVDQLEREHAGEPWHGSPLTQILQKITATQAATRPIAGGHSIWELVLHIAAWKNEVRHRIEGGLAGEPAEGDWPPVGDTTEAAWKEALDNLELAHRLLVSAVKDFSETNLLVPSNDSRADGLAPTYYELLHGVVQHDVYHAGQIAILKKAFT